jgi:DNA invertase Pin-like site-specific DNA recombinase
MTSSELVQAHHRRRKAIIYIRQSTVHQVLHHLESSKLQHAMRETARRLGWDDEQIEVVETDTGLSAQSTAGRDGYKNLLGRIAMGLVGIVLSYESTRLSRNCTDWYPLLDVCALSLCLIGDRDGVYDPSTPNGRLLLGMKGIVSELELHTLRGRLLAGVQNKARRGELAVQLPVGLVRWEGGRVVKNPDLHVQEMIALVFHTFFELRKTTGVTRRLRERELLLPIRHRNTDVVWKLPTMSSVTAILKNPAYAGAFTFGKKHSVRSGTHGEKRRSKTRLLPMEQWPVVVQQRYPSYVSWAEFLEVQQMLRDNHADYQRKYSRGTPREGTALLHGITFCGACGHKMRVSYAKGHYYLCNSLRKALGAGPYCQYLSGESIDRAVVDAFFQALSPIELDLYDHALASRREQQMEIERAQQREQQRLQYEVHLARRQYDRVDPDNRLVAEELERRWEQALRASREAETRFEQARARESLDATALCAEQRAEFATLGESLPRLWKNNTMSMAQRKTLLRCLIDKVVLDRRRPDQVHTRIVWKGGAVSEVDVALPVRTLRAMPGYEALVKETLSLEAQGLSDQEIARTLTESGHRSLQGRGITALTVERIRREQGRLHRYRCSRARRIPGYLTVPQLAEVLEVKTTWLYRWIREGIVDVKRDPKTRLYLVPDDDATRERFQLLCVRYDTPRP